MTHQVGDRFVNPITKKINTIVKVETDHYYPGDGHIGNMYHLTIEGTTRTIQLTPILISRFEKI